MPTPTVSFTVGLETVEITGPDYPEHPGEDLAQFTQGAMGGRITSVTQATAVQYRPVLTWEALPDDEFLLLKDFLHTVAVGAESVMTYEDYRGTTWTARYLGGIGEAEQDEFQCWNLKLRLALFEV